MATYSFVRENLAKVWDEVEQSDQAAIIQRRGHRDMALIPADELASLEETVHLLRSPRNAARLLSALVRADRGTTPPTELKDLRELIGLPRDI